MDRNTGRRISALQHLQQSITTILATPIGSRVMRRDFGSLVPALLDKPMNTDTQTRVFSAATSALMRWEPRVRIDKLELQRDAERPGRAALRITGSYVSSYGREPAPLSVSVPLTGQGMRE
ncbi:baseplate assembly chaperone [Acidovorax phage Acica]|nr:baseplate assembly chaperone [Acidovorax phage Acica]